ncbi:hypothetical protein BCL57_001103 [Agromyces flavus]|uniref:Uncharacterized protein n=1 Tax=Agromyces flavus TaxID=589382 RepID=A0A1H1Z7U6_9MICO|nr:hypothetical protein [Agromyces flavus]MCP2366949.1 hypothetical protein [Agromyces flavus]GGI46704.1 hypothetical protein GCM10010932_15950 [Agromyces flavus]SDT29286.1 hypothetical protein SAMN04489721_3028 [Agromyces flavus]
MAEIDPTEQTGVSRRTVTKAMAWAAPVVAIAATAPLAAASCIPTVTLGPGSCKCPGQSTDLPWHYFLKICAGGVACPESSAVLVITKVYTKANAQPRTIWQGSQEVATGDCVVVEGFANNSGNFLEIEYHVKGTDTTLTAEVASPPDCNKTQNALGTCPT